MNENTNYTIIGAVRNMLMDLDPAPFTRDGLQTLHTRIEHYIDDLLLESIRIAKRHNSETVSPRHVDRAADLVFARTRRNLSTLAGVFGGAAIGGVMSFALELSRRNDALTPSEAVVACLLVGLGVFGVTFQLMHE